MAAWRRAAYPPNHPSMYVMHILESFHPAVAAWFARTHPAPTEAQAQAWPAIQAGRDVLVAAPTGSGVDDVFAPEHLCIHQPFHFAPPSGVKCYA